MDNDRMSFDKGNSINKHNIILYILSPLPMKNKK